MQANLVFSPFVTPRLPLGIAGLKSYVEKNSDFSVKCFDFNGMFYNDLVNDIRQGKNFVEMSDEDKSIFLRAADTFENKNGEFFDQALYDASATTLFKSCFESLSKLLNENCGKAVREKMPAPWFAHKDIDLLVSNKPDVVGFSIMFPQQISFSILAAQMLKSVDNNIKIVFGGNSSTVAYKELLGYEAIDLVVLDEGEEAFLNLLNALNQSSGLEEVPNIAFRDENKITVTDRSMINKLDELPYPDFSDFDLNAYFTPEPVVGVLGTRGCYWRKCAFCTHYKSYFNKYRSASVERIVDELEHHVNNGIRYFDFVDEMIPAKRFREIGKEIIKRKLELYYYALAKPTSDFSQETFELMYKSGCRYIIWGLESGSQRVLDLINKGTKVSEISKVLSDSGSAGIKNHLFIIVGFPSETQQELDETINFLYENRKNIHSIHNGTFVLHKDTPIYENPAKFHIEKIYPESSNFCLDPVNYDISQGLTAEQAQRCRDFYHENYFEHFNYFSGHLRELRHHCLFVYANDDKLIFNLEKKPVPEPKQLVLLS